MSTPPSADPPSVPQPPVPQPPLHQSPEPLRAAMRAMPDPDQSPFGLDDDAARPRRRVRRWRAVWQLPLLWGVPATIATVATLLARKNIESLVPLIGAGMGLPVYLGLRQWHVMLILGLACGLTIFTVIGLLYDVLVRYRAHGDSWWDRNWTFFLALCTVALVVSSRNAYDFDGWVFAYGVGVMFLALGMLVIAAVWGVCRLVGGVVIRGRQR